MGIALLAIAAAGSVVSTIGGLQAGAAKKKAQQAEARALSMRAARERTVQVREGRKNQAQVLQAAANSGVSESSGAVSGAAGAMTSAFGNVKYINQQESAGKAVSTAEQEMTDAQGIVTLGSGITDIAGSAFNAERSGAFE